MSPARDPAARAARAEALRPALATAAVLLFVWPLVRVPRLSLGAAWAHLFAAWALLIVVLWFVARAGRRSAPNPGGAGARNGGA